MFLCDCGISLISTATVNAEASSNARSNAQISSQADQIMLYNK